MTPFPISITEPNYPRNPNPAQLRNLYCKLRADAVTLVRSRAQYVGQVTRQQEQILSLQKDLAQFSTEMELSLQQKAHLNRIIKDYGTVLKQLEDAGATLVETVEGKGWQGAFSMSSLLAAVRAFLVAWKAALHNSKAITTTEVTNVDR